MFQSARALARWAPAFAGVWKLLRRVLADERLHPVERAGSVGRVGLAGHEAVIGALVELHLDLAAGLFPAVGGTLRPLDWDPLVDVAAEQERGRQMALFAAVEDR